MRYDVTMPSLGADMEEGKLLQWRIGMGDEVKKGQALAEVETQKAAVEIEAFRDGQVRELIAKPGDVIPVGGLIARMEVSDSTATADTPKVVSAPTPAPAVPSSEEVLRPPGNSESGPDRIRISPAARRLAQKEGIDINLIQGTGPNGIIELRDVESLLKKQSDSSQVAGGIDQNGLREVIARQMSKSKKEIPHYYLVQRISLDSFITWVDSENQKRDAEGRLLIPALLQRAVVKVLPDCPDLNGFYVNGKFQPTKAIHLGIAVALKPSGVIVPALLDAETLTLEEHNLRFKGLMERARSGGLRNREMTDGTITVTQVGDLGAHQVTGVIFPPQVAIVGMGRVRQEPVIFETLVRPGWVVDVTLSADHRVSDGLAGSRFLHKLDRLLQSPEKLTD